MEDETKLRVNSETLINLKGADKCKVCEQLPIFCAIEGNPF